MLYALANRVSIDIIKKLNRVSIDIIKKFNRVSIDIIKKLNRISIDIIKKLNRVSAIFHFSLFTFHFSLKKNIMSTASSDGIK
ncbi:MAG: hypothetical protein MSA39_03330 [Prevotella sp.]|nr:hypothetical protein [Prevotella sp.]